jgi:hypothetical protein
MNQINVRHEDDEAVILQGRGNKTFSNLKKGRGRVHLLRKKGNNLKLYPD